MKDSPGATPSSVLTATPLAASPALHSLPQNLVLPNIPKPPPELGGLAAGRLYTGQTLKAGWRPSGVLVAHLHEHGGPVNEVQVTRDNLFFASASDDGTVKIWDCQRLEKNVTNRSRLTYSSQAGKILSLCVCENSHSIASASSSGSIHVFRVERIKRDKSPVPEYTGVSTVQNIDRAEGAIVKVDHFDALSSSQSLIVYATDAGIVHAWDLRARREAWYEFLPLFSM
jgi:phosphoinositide-3-kinase, regulatory subunit 4